MQITLERISSADSEQIHILLDAVLERFKVLFPEWEVGTISIRRRENTEEEINRTIALLESVKRISIKEESLKKSMDAGVDSIHLDT